MVNTGDGKHVAVVTGASSGIGRATALELAKSGAVVVLASRNASALDNLAADIQSCNGTAYPFPTDITNYDHLNRLVQSTVQHFGHIDVWVNSAGYAERGAFDQLGLGDIERSLDTNLKGTIYATLAILPHFMERRRGIIITIGSYACFRGTPYRTIYSAAKHGTKGFFEALRVELSQDHPDITLTLVHPGFVTTAIQHDNHRRSTAARLLLRPQGPEAIAQAVRKATQGRRRDVYIGVSGRIITVLEGLFPSLLDRIYARAVDRH